MEAGCTMTVSRDWLGVLGGVAVVVLSTILLGLNKAARSGSNAPKLKLKLRSAALSARVSVTSSSSSPASSISSSSSTTIGFVPFSQSDAAA